MKTIDFSIDWHTHAFDNAVSQDPLAFAVDYKESYWKLLMKLGQASSLQTWPTLSERLIDMDNAKVKKAVLLGWYWENPESCKRQNQYFAEILSKYPKRFQAFAALAPQAGPSWVIEELKRCEQWGFSGAGELCPQVQKYNLLDQSHRKWIEWLQERKWWINFHVTDPVVNQSGSFVPTPLIDFIKFADLYPEQKIILSHLGGLLCFYEHNPRLKHILKNTYYDTAAIPLLYTDSIYKGIPEMEFFTKILFGTDYPMKSYPKLSRSGQYSRHIKGLGFTSNLSAS